MYYAFIHVPCLNEVLVSSYRGWYYLIFSNEMKRKGNMQVVPNFRRLRDCFFRLVLV